jgi:hypothetical protein
MKWLFAMIMIGILGLVLGLGKFEIQNSTPCHGADCAPMTQDCALHCFAASSANEVTPAIAVSWFVLAAVSLAFAFSHQLLAWAWRPFSVLPHRDPRLILITNKRE